MNNKTIDPRLLEEGIAAADKVLAKKAAGEKAKLRACRKRALEKKNFPLNKAVKHLMNKIGDTSATQEEVLADSEATTVDIQ